MKVLYIAVLCLFFPHITMQADDSRQLIVLFDWNRERISKDLDKTLYTPGDDGWGPPTGNLVTALAQKGAPIFVTSSLWHNFVARRKVFKDFLDDKGMSYKNTYVRFSTNQAITQFQKRVQAYFQANGQRVLGNFGSAVRSELDSYFMCYVTPFKKRRVDCKKSF